MSTKEIVDSNNKILTEYMPTDLQTKVVTASNSLQVSRDGSVYDPPEQGCAITWNNNLGNTGSANTEFINSAGAGYTLSRGFTFLNANDNALTGQIPLFKIEGGDVPNNNNCNLTIWNDTGRLFTNYFNSAQTIGAAAPVATPPLVGAGGSAVGGLIDYVLVGGPPATDIKLRIRLIDASFNIILEKYF